MDVGGELFRGNEQAAFQWFLKNFGEQLAEVRNRGRGRGLRLPNCGFDEFSTDGGLTCDKCAAGLRGIDTDGDGINDQCR